MTRLQGLTSGDCCNSPVCEHGEQASLPSRVDGCQHQRVPAAVQQLNSKRPQRQRPVPEQLALDLFICVIILMEPSSWQAVTICVQMQQVHAQGSNSPVADSWCAQDQQPAA